MPSHDAPVEDVQELLWLAATEVLGSDACHRPSDAADQITQTALLRTTCPSQRRVLESWCGTTRRVLRADVPIPHEDWRQTPVGLAVQLVLARPEPSNFKTWCTTMMFAYRLPLLGQPLRFAVCSMAIEDWIPAFEGRHRNRRSLRYSASYVYRRPLSRMAWLDGRGAQVAPGVG